MLDDNLDIKNFIKKISVNDTGLLLELREFACANHVPIISNEVADLLNLILSLRESSKILELGTAIGYSAILIGQYLKKNNDLLITIEKENKMLELAKKNFERANLSCIKLIHGDARNILPELKINFDIIFLDIAKGQYIRVLKDCVRLLNQNGLLICDDIFQNGNTLKDRKKIPRRQRTIQTRMQNFIHEIFENKFLETKLFNIGDGVLISMKKN